MREICCLSVSFFGLKWGLFRLDNLWYMASLVWDFRFCFLRFLSGFRGDAMGSSSVGVVLMGEEGGGE